MFKPDLTNHFSVTRVGHDTYLIWSILYPERFAPELRAGIFRLFAIERAARRMLGKQILGDISKPVMPSFGSVIFFHVDCFDELTNLLELYK